MYAHFKTFPSLECRFKQQFYNVTLKSVHIHLKQLIPSRFFREQNFHLIECDMTLLATEVVDEKYRCIYHLNTQCNLPSCVVETKVIQPIIDIHTQKSCV